MVTVRGPTLAIHSPPAKAAKPSVKIVMLKARLTSETVAPYASVSGTRKTLQAYTALRAIYYLITPAMAINQRLVTFWLAA